MSYNRLLEVLVGFSNVTKLPDLISLGVTRNRINEIIGAQTGRQTRGAKSGEQKPVANPSKPNNQIGKARRHNLKQM